MFCVNCFHENTSIKNSRPHKKRPSVWRRRYCSNCGTSFTTIERPSLTDTITVYTPSGIQENFNLGKLIVSIAEVFSHNPSAGKNQALALAQTVETTLSSEIRTITTEDIEAVTHQVLKRFDELAAIQYAARHQLIVSVKRRGRPSLSSPEPRKPQSPSQ